MQDLAAGTGPPLREAGQIAKVVAAVTVAAIRGRRTNDFSPPDEDAEAGIRGGR